MTDSASLRDIDGVGQLLIISKHVVTYSMTTENLCYRALRYTAVHRSSLWSTPSTMNVCVRPDKYDLNQLSAKPSITNRSRKTVSRQSWSTVSYAELKSSNTKSLCHHPLLITSFTGLTTAVSVLSLLSSTDSRAGKKTVEFYMFQIPLGDNPLHKLWNKTEFRYRSIRVQVGLIKCRFLQPG